MQNLFQRCPNYAPKTYLCLPFPIRYNMKRFFLLGLTALIALTGCEKDFEVAAPYKDIMLVYGIIDPLDSAHYIRIQKAFLDENKSAIEMSKIPDSSYFSNLAVKIQEYTGTDKLV